VTRPTSPSIIILGGGLAGLTAAYRLAAQGARVTVLDRRSALGGNAIQSDQGWKSAPLVASFSHQATWALWLSLRSGISPALLTHVPLEFLLPDGSTVAYPYSPLPQPVHFAVSLLRFSGLTWQERWRLASWLEQIWEGAVQLPSDLAHRTADEWLAGLGQGDRARRTIWDPLAEWLTGNQLRHLSADAFLVAIEPTFLQSAAKSRWAITSSLQAALVQPMIEKLRTIGATILLDTEATQLLSEGDQVTEVHLQDGSTLQGDWYLVALPPRSLTALLPERWLSRYAYFQQFAELIHLPATSAQAIIGRALTRPRIVLLGQSPFYSMVAQPSGSDRLVCRFSGRDERTDASSTPEALQAHAEKILRSLQLLSAGETLVSFDHQRNEDGGLSLEPGMQLRRPLQRSPITNLLVAGAWTDTGWPPNAESAIVSANRCAEIIASPSLGRNRME
jgi:glycine/D-amino acid oxidase-like deaminating enzyme